MYIFTFQTTNELQMLKDAHCTVIAVIEEQMVIHESFQKDAPPQSRAVYVQYISCLPPPKQITSCITYVHFHPKSIICEILWGRL